MTFLKMLHKLDNIQNMQNSSSPFYQFYILPVFQNTEQSKKKSQKKDFHRFISKQFHLLAQKLRDDTNPDITVQDITNALKNLKNGLSTSAD